MKGSIIADHLVDHVVEDYEPLDFHLPDEEVLVIRDDVGVSEWWTLYFDEAINVLGNGVGALIISPDRMQYLFSVRLHFECTNNTTEYEACIIGLEAALELKVKKLEVFGDSMLTIYQVKGE